MDKHEIFLEIKRSLVDMDEDKVVELCEETLKRDIAAYETITEALIPGMDEVSKLYEEEEYFLPEVLICADAMNAGLDVVKPHLDKNLMEEKIKVVIGVVEGDTHDIGKTLVKIMMESGGIEVYDLGRDVPLKDFIEKAEEVDAHIIGMSTLMTTTMGGMETVINMLKEKNLREKYKVLIGGGPISQNFANRIGADLYAKDANEAVRKLKEMMKGV